LTEINFITDGRDYNGGGVGCDAGYFQYRGALLKKLHVFDFFALFFILYSRCISWDSPVNPLPTVETQNVA
jgi:hypothetical protein